MAIAYNAVSSGNVAGASSLTFSHTTAGTDRLLVVDVDLRNSGSSVSGVTYAGVAMTQLTSISNASSNFKYTYYLINPAVGTNNVVISTGGGTTTYANATSYTGVLQVSPIDSQATLAQNNSGDVFTISTTVVNPGCWVHGFASLENATSVISLASNKTDRASQLSSVSGFTSSDTNAVVNAGSQSITWTKVNSGGFAMFAGISFSFKASAVGGAFLLRMI